jgi:hypothetical protein
VASSAGLRDGAARTSGPGRRFFEHPQHFSNECEFNIGGAGEISTRMRQAINEAVLDVPTR